MRYLEIICGQCNKCLTNLQTSALDSHLSVKRKPDHLLNNPPCYSYENCIYYGTGQPLKPAFNLMILSQTMARTSALSVSNEPPRSKLWDKSWLPSSERCKQRGIIPVKE